MKYTRPAFNDPAIPIIKGSAFYLPTPIDVPRFPTPVSVVENFRLAAARNKPYWLPNSLTDFQTLMTQDAVYVQPGGVQLHANFQDPRNYKEDYKFDEWFGSNWTWVLSAGGAMLTPGAPSVCDDITQWEKQIKFPNLADFDFEGRAKDFDRDPDKVMHYDIGRGVTERLVSLMGGYEEGMMALALEPEAVRDFFDRYADFVIEFFDKINSLYRLDMLTLHDDWGTERDTFFSEKMMEELVFEPTKKIIDHIHSKGVVFELHSCGSVSRFLPYIEKLEPEFLQLQGRVVDLAALKEKYGKTLGVNSPIEGAAPGAPMDEQLAAIRASVDKYGKYGGAYTSVFSMDPETMWAHTAELFYYSREFYDNEAKR